ncbi:hypothetical protein [Lacinutrix sp. Bg11-31]|uniref:hypothetical protein n=1 Tax=Lacinutrix sp. Bg11-31 TaxID=2057808 RepID=UPI000C3069EB|nr:hypothetical protein [Lacinutrix sp. Bg11-31]AUC81158.1 hypothetical protein CW733_03025 [Lacinutrix sp. Bg11-31]
MKRVHTHLKFIKFHNPEDLHQDSLTCISQLLFKRDELDFLNELIKEHTLDLISEKTFEQSKAIATELVLLKKELKPLLFKVENHKNELQLLLDDVKVPNELEDYKEEHYKIMFEAIAFNTEFKTLKKRIYILIKNIMKANKSKRLLN